MGVSLINWLDYFFIIILIVTSLKGYSLGLLLGAVRLAELVVSYWVAAIYHNRVAQWLAQEWGWADSIAQLLKPLVKLPGSFNNQEILQLPVALLKKISSEIPLPSPWTEIIDQLGQMGQHQTVGQAVNLLLAQGILRILAFIAIFIIVKAAVNFIGSIFGIILKFTPLGPVDKLAGIALGFATGIVIIFVLMTILIPLQVPLALMGVEGFMSTLEKGISNSHLIEIFGPYVKEMNILPPVIPEFSSQFLFKHIPNGPGTEV